MPHVLRRDTASPWEKVFATKRYPKEYAIAHTAAVSRRHNCYEVYLMPAESAVGCLFSVADIRKVTVSNSHALGAAPSACV